MVYCGRPSKGCAPCRVKRTKCDQARPFCGQCRRARRDCPGYRDEEDTLFRDETSKIIIKVKKGSAYANSKPVLSTSLVGQLRDSAVLDDVTNFSIAPTQIAERGMTQSRSLSIPLEDEATCYFFRNFLSNDYSSEYSMNAYSSVLPNLHRQDSSFGAMTNVINAIGSASISNMKRSPKFMIAASQQYGAALRAINFSIQDSSSASADQTLIAVMLLGVFETVTCSNPESMRAWANHVKGASAIARLRGKTQLRTKAGRTIFAILQFQILIDCLQRSLMVPPHFIDWAEIAAGSESEERRPEHHLYLIVARLCALRATGERPHNNSIAVITLANLIDFDLKDWMGCLPPDFLYSTLWSTDIDSVFSGAYHVYENTWALGILNLYRSARILTQETILNWLNRDAMADTSFEKSQRNHCNDIIVELAYEICASVPFILGCSGSSIDSLQRQNFAALTGLLWPLYTVATVELQVPGMRAWIITRLEVIGLTMGVKQAEALAHVLRTKKEITAWDKFETIQADEVLDDW